MSLAKVRFSLSHLLLAIAAVAVLLAIHASRQRQRGWMYQSVVLVSIDDFPGTVSACGDRRQCEDGIDAFLRAQVELVKSRPVLEAALRSPGVSELEVSTGWIERNLKVEFIGLSRLLSISMRGPDHPELALLVNAVTDAYLETANSELRDWPAIRERNPRIGRVTRAIPRP